MSKYIGLGLCGVCVIAWICLFQRDLININEEQINQLFMTFMFFSLMVVLPLAMVVEMHRS